MNKIDRDTDYHCWDMVHKGDNRDTKSIEMDASWKALHNQMPKEPKQKGKRIFRGKDGKLKEYSPSEAWVKGNNFKKANESKNMNKKLIRLTESDLHRIVKESVKRILKESMQPNHEEIWNKIQNAWNEALKWSRSWGYNSGMRVFNDELAQIMVDNNMTYDDLKEYGNVLDKVDYNYLNNQMKHCRKQMSNIGLGCEGD